MGYKDIVIVTLEYSGGGSFSGRSIADSRITTSHVVLNDAAVNGAHNTLAWETKNGEITITSPTSTVTDAFTETFILGVPDN